MAKAPASAANPDSIATIPAKAAAIANQTPAEQGTVKQAAVKQAAAKQPASKKSATASSTRGGVVTAARRASSTKQSASDKKRSTVVRAGRGEVPKVVKSPPPAEESYVVEGGPGMKQPLPLFLPEGPGMIFHGPGPAHEDPLCDDLVPLRDLKLDLVASKGEMPKDYAALCFDKKPVILNGAVAGRMWNSSLFQWQAPSLCYQPLYFEEPALERTGYSYGVFQPGVSAAHFFCTIPALPYLMTVHRPRECIFTLGHYRPGDKVPYSVIHPPLRLDAATVEGAFWTGLIFLVP